MVHYDVKVSVCIPTYNYGRFIADAIESVLRQTFADFELIIVDNNSNDNTKEIVERYIKKDDRIRYYRNELNIGMVENWNRCLELARGSFVKIMCADDLLEPESLEIAIELFKNNLTLSLVGTARGLVTEKLSLIKNLAYSDKLEVVQGFEMLRKCLYFGNIIGEPTCVLMKKSCINRGFDGNFRQLTDLEMWMYLLKKGDFAYIPKVLCKIRQHDNQETKKNLKNLINVDEDFFLFNKYISTENIRLSYLKRNYLKFKRALNIWNLKEKGLDSDLIKSKISEHYGLVLFYISLFLWKMFVRIKVIREN